MLNSHVEQLIYYIFIMLIKKKKCITNPVFVRKKRGKMSLSLFAQFIRPRPDSLFTTMRHLSWRIQAGSFLPPYFTHYLDTDLAGSAGTVSLFRHRSCQLRGRNVWVLAVASFQPDRMGGKKWLSASLCHVLPTCNSRRCLLEQMWEEGKSERLAHAGREMYPLQGLHVTLWIFSVACCNLSLAIIRRLQLWQRPCTVHSKRRNVMLTLH